MNSCRSTPEEGGETVFPQAADVPPQDPSEFSECARKGGLALKVVRATPFAVGNNINTRETGWFMHLLLVIITCVCVCSSSRSSKYLSSLNCQVNASVSCGIIPTSQVSLWTWPSIDMHGQVKGDALMFYSLHPDGSLDPTSMHGSCPTLKGDKWSATKWIHVGPFR